MITIDNSVFWIDGFDVQKKTDGVSSKFKKYLKTLNLGYDEKKDYACANSSITPSTAISRKKLEELRESDGRLFYGRYIENSDSWIVKILDKKELLKKMDEKREKGDNGNRLNINENKEGIVLESM